MERIEYTKQLLQVAEVELVYLTQVKPSERVKLAKSNDSYELLMQVWDLGKLQLQEQFKVILLNQAMKVLGIYTLSQGGITGTVIDIRLMFSVALKANAVSMIVAHNHPSGNLKPSVEDNKSTEKIKEAGKILDIKLLDHMIVTTEGYYSYADHGLL